jgi:hypothetical protein
LPRFGVVVARNESGARFLEKFLHQTQAASAY